ncbi:mechanosensitive ion channel domain-containing protein [Lyngbya aestuarii]|uniref:mechanosensitive ion channel domain-containing protein n=1 Tax=Lyngbya aestuarii TaxID=118322 RepID=UPI00403E2D99
MRSKTWPIRLKAIASLQVGSVVVMGWFTYPVQAQLPFLPELKQQTSSLLNQLSESTVASSCVRLDGRCIFEVTAQKPALPARRREIQENLASISHQYFQAETSEVKVEIQEENRLPVIYVNGQRLLTVTEQDASRIGEENPQNAALTLRRRLQRALEKAKWERQDKFLVRQGGIAAGTAVAMLLASLAICRWERRLKISKEQLAPATDSPDSRPISTRLTEGQQWNLTEVQHRLLQLAQVGILTGGSLFILSLFPYTRIAQVLIVTSIRIPLRVVIVSLGTYLAVRLSYALIDRFNSALASNYLQTPQADRRLQLRVTTITSVTKSVVTIAWIGIGFVVALTVIGVDVGPLLAGAGIIGVALSLASQNLIKDFINGFFIIWEDQYGVGDVIVVGDVGGFVENMNLRITQLRNEEGRLITIPNSEVRIVGNLSNHWSRADLSIPVAYQTDVDKALYLVDQVAQQMSKDQLWRNQILEPPLLLGVDGFGQNGFIIRVWIKTQPLKQWDVSREFRRRIKVAFDEAEIAISLSRQEIWFNQPPVIKSLANGHRE